ncbi:MAG: DUF1294 domain-containing protein [Sphingobium sp.]|nr:DUF1294 domain-containing protein [Sphingobium sp.]
MAVQPEIWVYLALANLAAFAAFGYDKARARAGKWRVRERDLLLLVLLGGGAGAVLGRLAFRHKTRKPGFSAAIYLIALAELGLFCWLALAPRSWP